MTMTPTDASERERLVASLLDSALEKANDYDCESNVFDEEKAADMLRADAEKIRALEADAARYRWWRLNSHLIEEDEAGLAGCAFSCQIPLQIIEGPREILMDMVADYEIALAATQSPRSEAGGVP